MTESRWEKTCRTRDLFNLSDFYCRLLLNPSQRTPPGDPSECRHLRPNCPQPPLLGLPSSPPAPKHRSRGGVRTARREIGVWRDDYRRSPLFSLASVFSPARGGQGSPVTSGAIVTPHYSAPSTHPPARSQRALLWKRGGRRAHLVSGKIEPERRGHGAQRPVGDRNIWCPLQRRRQRGPASPLC